MDGFEDGSSNGGGGDGGGRVIQANGGGGGVWDFLSGLGQTDESSVAADGPVLVLAATNRPEVLDQALVRPGRFDRLVTVGRPDASGRAAILRVHVRSITTTATPADVTEIAKEADGFSGADLVGTCG